MFNKPESDNWIFLALVNAFLFIFFVFGIFTTIWNHQVFVLCAPIVMSAVFGFNLKYFWDKEDI